MTGQHSVDQTPQQQSCLLLRASSSWEKPNPVPLLMRWGNRWSTAMFEPVGRSWAFSSLSQPHCPCFSKSKTLALIFDVLKKKKICSVFVDTYLFVKNHLYLMGLSVLNCAYLKMCIRFYFSMYQIDVIIVSCFVLFRKSCAFTWLGIAMGPMVLSWYRKSPLFMHLLTLRLDKSWTAQPLEMVEYHHPVLREP